jgi:sugar (pentulose or hexulose) kinase
MFPITNGGYDRVMLEKFDKILSERNLPFTAGSVLPEVLSAGEKGSYLTEEGARLLDPTGNLSAGIPLCPPEGDAGTGMTATASVKPSTGNVSAGTSIFSMLVLEKPLKGVYPQIDSVTTPDGAPVAMVHCNNCCSELDSWVNLFGEFAALSGRQIDKSELYSLLYRNSLKGSADCGGVTAYNFISGEPVADIEEGRPMVYREYGGAFSLADFFRAQIYSTMASLKIGMDILFDKEKAAARLFSAHGGLFKTEGVAQQYLADALGAPVAVMKTAGEGGAWGMALLAAYMVKGGGKTLADFLEEDVFADMEKTTLNPTADGERGFGEFMERYKKGLAAERAVMSR